MKTFEITRTENYYENEENSKYDEVCIRCGKGIKNPKHLVELVDGDLFALSKNENADYNDGGYMGFHPIGSECKKHLPSEFVHKA